jgi:endonuclease/exonuclease/phosphatase family metal-dependent hydrolase
MRLASFNVENLFRRPKALNTVGWDDGQGKAVLNAYSRLEETLQKPVYGAAEKEQILTDLGTLGLLDGDESEWAFLRRPRGALLRRPEVGPVEVIAKGRADWIGWLELKREAVNETATRNTARVVADIGADVLAVIEAEDRPALDRFNRDVLPTGFTPKKQAFDYRHVMLVDGNDDRGIDVGLLTRTSYPIERMRSHVADRDSNGNAIFSRDCAEYEIQVANSDPVLLLVNHFKSKGYGSQSSSNAKRRQQAQRVARIYKERRKEGWKRVAVVGDLNDTPDSKPLSALVKLTDLTDVADHAKFKADVRKGTYGTGNDKIDYLLLSPELFATVQSAAYHRAGVYRGPRVKNPWVMYNTIRSPLEQASDHAAVWANLKL